jgi:flavin reductase (DIM6/NTAB) family NADH-FMN oxidoreductase RutF
MDSKLQRQVMGQFATGVTIVTTKSGDTLSGMTANAVMSLSLDPPLIVVSVDREGTMHGLLEEGGCFAVNVLKREQEHLSRRFAERGEKDFSDLQIKTAETGAPVLCDALAFADCRIVEVARGGDHDMFIGEMVAGAVAEGKALIFFGGEYRGLAEDESK